jgi:hypothetical protein
MIISSSDIQWEDEKINRWNLKNRSLPSSIAKVYEDTETSRIKQYESRPQPTIAETLFIQCIPNCESCNGFIVIADSGRRYKCGCLHHSLAELDNPRV